MTSNIEQGYKEWLPPGHVQLGLIPDGPFLTLEVPHIIKVEQDAEISFQKRMVYCLN